MFRRGLDLKALNGGAVLLAIEVANSSLAYDTGRKSRIYAAYGVREAWVINANTLATRVFRQPIRTQVQVRAQKGLRPPSGAGACAGAGGVAGGVWG